MLLTTSIASFYPDIPSWVFYLCGLLGLASAPIIPKLPLIGWIFYLYGLLGLANVVFVIFLFKWKKWAFFALCVSAVIIFIMNIAIGVGITTAITGFLGVVILYLIMRHKWDLFE